VWDQVRWREPVLAVAAPWITLAAVATATRRVWLGPMVTPLARRRPVKVARETATPGTPVVTLLLQFCRVSSVGRQATGLRPRR
jgi:hypothetical protein